MTEVATCDEVGVGGWVGIGAEPPAPPALKGTSGPLQPAYRRLCRSRLGNRPGAPPVRTAGSRTLAKG